MSEKKTWGKTVLGWFVVQDGESPGGTPGAAPTSEPSAADADALIAKYAAEPAAPPPVELKGELPRVVEGKVEFAQVYEAAGVDEDERDRITKALDLLRSLPAETPQPVKKQIVEASLKAFGVPTELIIEAGVQSIEALESFVRAGQASTQSILTESNERIAALEAEIAQVKAIMEQAVKEQYDRTTATNAEKLRVQQVLEFFGQEAVMKVVRDSPKLHEPG